MKWIPLLERMASGKPFQQKAECKTSALSSAEGYFREIFSIKLEHGSIIERMNI